MAFENTTFFEVHVHLPDEDDESPRIERRTERSAPEPESESKPFLTRGRKIAALAGASIVVSVVVSIAAKRLADAVSGKLSRGESGDDEPGREEAEIAITE